ncbi:hypothetical protein V3C99_009276 [Haemonchus contortus]
MLLCFTLITSLDYREQLWVRNLQHTTYQYFLNNYQRMRNLYLLKLFARNRTTTPISAVPSDDNATTTHENAKYVNLAEVFYPPRTVDNEIGLPLNQPLDGQKVSFTQFYGQQYGRK